MAKRIEKLEITQEELALLIEGLGCVTSEFCTSREEEKPYDDLASKLAGLKGKRSQINIPE